MQQFMQFLSENYSLVLMLGVGLLLTQQRFPLVHLILGARYITAAEALSQFKKSVVVDLRAQEHFQTEHVKNAAHYSDYRHSASPNGACLLYGDEKTAYTQHLLALKKQGVTNIQIIIGGFSACKAAGLPISTNRK